MKPDDSVTHSDYAEEPLTVAQTAELTGNVLLEFGTPWCGHCQAARNAIQEAVAEHPSLHHIKIYDGKGKRLGRSFNVKRWPTLILLHNGQEVDRLVRPLRADEVRRLLVTIKE